MKKLIRSEVFWIMALAVILRLAFLDIKPPHFDEGVNGWFVDQMVKNGYFQYDPTNYHGPLYFYLLFISQELLGRNLWALRLPAVIASLLSVFWMFRFRDFFSRKTVAWAALAMAVSPGYVFYGRYSIHESLLVFSTMLLMWGALGILMEGRRKYLLGATIGLAGLILTKETWAIHATCFVMALGCLQLWQRFSHSTPPLAFARQQWTYRDKLFAVLGLLFAIVFFYSGNFLRFDTLGGIVEAYFAWFRTGAGAGGHIKTEYQLGTLLHKWAQAYLSFSGAKPGWLHVLDWINVYWLYLMGRYEWPAIIGIAACIRLLWPAPATIRLIGIYACGVVAAYSLIPYKTPWCIISLIWPFYLTFGYILESLKKRPLLLPATAAILIIASLAWSIRLNFFNYANHKEPYVYVQTDKEYSILTKPILHLAASNPENYYLTGQILLESYYPLPWVFGDFTNIGYYKKPPEQLDADFIVVESSKAKEVEHKLSQPYYRREFQLRDAQEKSVVYFRAEKFAPEFPYLKPEIIPSIKP
ncbi:MAG: flippase activity-associated protein Agl23 [Chthoniobacterales bacterium]